MQLVLTMIPRSSTVLKNLENPNSPALSLTSRIIRLIEHQSIVLVEFSKHPYLCLGHNSLQVNLWI